MYPIDVPLKQFFDLDGRPLDCGYLYFGEPNQNPETKPITVYWDIGGTQPAAQPIRTLNGYPVRSGTAAQVFTPGTYSVTVKDQFQRLIIYSASSENFDQSAIFSEIFKVGVNRVVHSIAELRTLDKNQYNHAFVSGYYADGDGGGGPYYYDASDNSSPDNGGTVIVAADGGRWKLVNSTVVSARQFGAKGDGTADDTAAMVAFGAESAKRKHIPGGTYRITNKVDFQPGDIVTGDGAKTIIDASDVAWAAPYVFGVSGVLTPIAGLGSNVQRGSAAITLASAPDVQTGNVIVIFNPTNSSFSTWRPYYKAGEMCRVASVSGNTVNTMGITYGAYTAGAVNLYRLDGASTQFKDFVIRQAPTANVGLKASLIDRPIVENVMTSGSTYCGIEIDRCFDIDVLGPAFQYSPAVDDEYGLLISNSQGGMIQGCFYGGRHAVAMGGSSATGCVPVRGITVIAPTMGNNANIGAHDLHGNTEDIRFIGGRFVNGGTIAGKNHKFIGCSFIGNKNSGIALYGGEVIGGIFEFTECHFESLVNPNASGFGMIEISNTTVALAGITNFIFSDCTYYAPTGCTYIVNCALNGTGQDISLIFNGATLVFAPSVTQFLRISKASGAGRFDTIQISDIAGMPIPGAAYVVPASGSPPVVRYRLPEQEGALSIAISSSASFYGGAVTFPIAYPIAPVVVCSKSLGTTGGKRSIVEPTTVTANNFQPFVYTCDGTNFSASDTVTVYWRARVAQ